MTIAGRCGARRAIAPGYTVAERLDLNEEPGPRRSRGRLLEDVDPAGRPETDDVGKTDLGTGDLAIACLPAEVMADLPDVGDAGCRDGVALGFEPAGHVDRHPPVPPGSSAVEEIDRPAGLAEHQVVVVDQLCGGETVVELDEIEVLRADAGSLVGLARTVAGDGVDVGEDLAALFPRIGGEDRSRDLHRAASLLERERLELGVRDDDGRRRTVAVRRAHR